MVKNKKELLEELEKKFEETKKELGFSATLRELDEVFFIKDAVLSAGFVSEGYSRQLCSRISETFGGWNGYLHALILPNPQNMINLNETKLLDESDKKEIMALIKGAVGFTSTNSLIGLTKNKKMEGEFIDGAFNYWKKTFQPGVVKILSKANRYWIS